MCKLYNDLNHQYFGPAPAPDEYIQYEWARIPHFYLAFYVYQYATGYSAATAISAKILAEGEAAANYIEFLKSGSSNDPVELLKIAGVDMSSPEPIRMAMETFKGLVEETRTTDAGLILRTRNPAAARVPCADGACRDYVLAPII